LRVIKLTQRMRNSVITLANNMHRDNPVRSLIFEKNRGLVGKQFLRHECWKSTDTLSHGSRKDFVKFSNPFDDNFFDDG